MDKTQAKFILASYRPDSPDQEDTVFTEALSLADTDPELRQWWEAEQAWDQEIRHKLQAFPVPADLKDDLLAAEKAQKTPAKPSRFRQHSMGIAAALFLFVGTWSILLVGFSQPSLTANEFAQQAVSSDLNHYSLDFYSDEINAQRTWLAQQDAPAGWRLPNGLKLAEGMGCKAIDVKGRNASMVCYKLSCGNMVHIYVIETKSLRETTPTGQVVLNDQENYSTAQWCDGDFYYVAVSRIPARSLKDLL